MSTTPRWLNADERRAWLAYVDFSTLLADHLNRQLRRDAGMTHADYSLLAHLSSTPDGVLGMSELAQRLKITRSRLTHAVNRLREVGLVDRREDPDDGRGQLAVLTDGGKALLERAALDMSTPCAGPCSTRSPRNRYGSSRRSVKPSATPCTGPRVPRPTRRCCRGGAGSDR